MTHSYICFLSCNNPHALRLGSPWNSNLICKAAVYCSVKTSIYISTASKNKQTNNPSCPPTIIYSLPQYHEFPWKRKSTLWLPAKPGWGVRPDYRVMGRRQGRTREAHFNPKQLSVLFMAWMLPPGWGKDKSGGTGRCMGQKTSQNGLGWNGP